jgi:hypothetical protein
VVTTVDPADQDRKLITSYPVDDATVQSALSAGQGTT